MAIKFTVRVQRYTGLPIIGSLSIQEATRISGRTPVGLANVNMMSCRCLRTGDVVKMILKDKRPHEFQNVLVSLIPN